MPLTRIKPEAYDELLQEKALALQALLSPEGEPAVEIHGSPALAYRMRAEFRIWHDGDDLYYAMFNPEQPKTPVRINEFPIASDTIQRAMPELLRQVKASEALRRKLFQVEFLSSLKGELLLTLVYHRALDEDWHRHATSLSQVLGARVVGRSRKQKLVLDEDYIEEELTLSGRTWDFRQYEQGFTQPNARVNIKMIEWACSVAGDTGGDLLELYCGNGNFTLPLSRHFKHVLATEVAKSSMHAARHNQKVNGVENLELVRLSAQEVCSALSGEREFRRLRELRQPLSDYCFNTVFVDPPRAGLDSLTEKFVTGFERIIYVSCNPQTLLGNLETIGRTHSLQRLALFDQFPYTDHMECGAYLTRRQEPSNDAA